MKVHELNVAASKRPQRVGRGISAGQGKTAGRGTKGQNARTGGGVRVGFEGGQNPLAKRLPKLRGFAAINPTVYQVVNLSQLSKFKAGSTVDPAAFAAAGLVKDASGLIKLLGNGELAIKLTIKVHAASASSTAAVTAQGGTIELIKPNHK